MEDVYDKETTYELRKNIVITILKTLENIKSNWFDVPEGQMYIRSTKRMDLFGKSNNKTLEISNISFYEHARGKGSFRHYLYLFEQESPQFNYNVILVEQIINERLYQFLKRNNYRDIYELTLLKYPEIMQVQMLEVFQNNTPNVYKFI
ncbi:MAG TPA: hypothetical protein VLG50_08105 [Candidatus Saccharimonadales bacterium]|nr:hypothetical protein [Candidatus Saccharimonadales bacterium]